MSLAVIDTGCANLSSVAFAFERLGEKPVITADADIIRSANHVILPGVGAAPYAMRNIKDRGLVELIQSLSQPVLGICLGMQLLFEELEEGGEVTQGLGVIKGRIARLDTQSLPTPHMGWNQLKEARADRLTQGLSTQAYAYFVHSFAAPVSEDCLMYSEYGTKFTAIVRKNNFYGCQFHPERSSGVGSKILSNFLKVAA